MFAQVQIPAHKTEGVNRTKTMRFYPSVFTGKELDRETGYGYFGARYMDYELMTGWLSVDPIADKYPSISPYAYCAWNPIKLTDPDGNHIDVVSNNDGTYTVKNGQVNKDLNIYIVDQNGERTGEILGTMLTKYSFFNDNNEVAAGAVINTHDNSGKTFLDEVGQSTMSLCDYIYDEDNGGRTWGAMDFKSWGITEKMSAEEIFLHFNRGMRLDGSLGIEGENVYGTARDVGNYTAGYMAGSRGLSKVLMRIGFDLYEGYSKGKHYPIREANVSIAAENMGYHYGFWRDRK